MIGSGFNAISYEKDGPIALVTLDRPSVLNAFNTRMRDELIEVLRAVADDVEVRALVLRGAGVAFCSGADLTEFETAPSPFLARRIRAARDAFGSLGSLTIPKLAVLHGHTIGSGLELALMCDIRIASARARFSMPEAQLGLVPAGGATHSLVRTIGPAASLDLLLTGRTIGARESLRMGLVHRVVADHDLAAEAWHIALCLAEIDPTMVDRIRSVTDPFL